MTRKSLIEFDHAQIPDPVDPQKVHEWAYEMLSYLVGGDANALPYGADLKFIRVDDEPCPINHLRRTREDANARIRNYLLKGRSA